MARLREKRAVMPPSNSCRPHKLRQCAYFSSRHLKPWKAICRP